MHKLSKVDNVEILMFAKWERSPKLGLCISHVQSEYATPTYPAHSRLAAT